MRITHLFCTFMFVMSLVVAWHWFYTFQGIYQYVSFDKTAPITSLDWLVKEQDEKGKYSLQAFYSFLVNERTYHGSQVLVSHLSNPFIAEDLKKKFQKTCFEVSFKEQDPTVSSLENLFPWKKSLAAITLTGIWIYFLWLGRYITRKCVTS